MPNRVITRFRYLINFLAVFIIASNALAAPIEQAYEQLKAQYLTLRNTDLQLKRQADWVSLANRFEQFVNKNPRSNNAVAALLNASILLHILYQHDSQTEYINQALSLLKQATSAYPKHSLADDIIVKQADILLYTLGDQSQAQILYQQVIDQYSDSDMFAIARQRLDAIEQATVTEVKSENYDSDSSSTKKVIVIDPGHGGEDFGAVGVAKSLEKDIVLSVAFELEKILKEELNATVRLTRRDDSFVPLAARTKVANDANADLFISLHANSSPAHKAAGLEVYYLDNSNDQASRVLAERENASLGFENKPSDVQMMLSDLIQNGKMSESIRLAELLNQSLMQELKPQWPDIKSLGIKKAPFYVLVGAHMPCVLVEMFFVDNISDGSKLLRRPFRRKLALGLSRGIAAYLE